MDSTNYLLNCREEFDPVASQKYGKPFNFSAIEESVRCLRHNRKAFTWQDVARFESKARKHWWFERFWAFPPKKEIERDLSGLTFSFWQLSDKNEEKIVCDLLRVFKSIEIASIILRFVRPDRYGIISPPVERVLGVRRGSDAVETYLGYLQSLRAIQKHYEFKRAADADMALWVLHEKCFGTLHDEKIKKEYRTDHFMLQLRAENLVSPLKDLSCGWLAKALEKTKPDLAGAIACYKLEILIREIAEAVGLVKSGSGFKIGQLIGQMHDRGAIDGLKKGEWTRLMSIRNALFHGDRGPNSKERVDVLKEVLALELERERDWSSFKNGDKR